MIRYKFSLKIPFVNQLILALNIHIY